MSGQAAPRGLSLHRVAELAARQNPAVGVAAADVLAAREVTRIARSKRRPVLSANGFATSGSYGSIYPSSSQVDPSYNLLAPSGALLDANLMLMVPILTSGLLDYGIRSAKSLERAASYDQSEVQGDAALRAEDAYLQVLLAAAKAAAAKSRVDAGQELVRTTRAQFEAGKGIEASVRRAEAELAQGQRAQTLAEGEREGALLDLKSETGIGPDDPIELSDLLDVELTVDDLQTSIVVALANRGVVLAAKARLDSAKADLQAVESGRRPQVYGVAMADTANQSMNRGASIGITVSVPLFDGGARQAETGRAKAMRERAVALVRQAEIAVQKEIRQAYIDLATSDSNVRSARESVRSAQSAYEVAALRVSSGKGVLIEQLDALQSLTQARADLATALYDRRIAEVRILRGTGAILVQEAGK